MSYRICDYDKENVMLELTVNENYQFRFSIQSVDPESHEWLAKLLDHYIQETVDRAVRHALNLHRAEFRAFIGL